MQAFPYVSARRRGGTAGAGVLKGAAQKSRQRD